MSLRALTHWMVVGALLVLGNSGGRAAFAWGQEAEIARKLKTKVTPVYPELARRMNISGVVKVQVTVDRNGAIKSTKLVGGHPILATAAMDAVRKWRYEGAADETTGVVEFHFDPTQ